MARFIEWEDSLRAAVFGSLLYPAVVLSVALAVTAFLLVVVLPKFQEVYTKAHVALPWVTKFMFALSSFVTGYWFVLIAIIVGLVLAYILIKRSPGGRLGIDRVKLQIPIVRSFITRVAAVRFARSLEIMARSGVPVVNSLKIIQDTMTNEVYARAVEDMTAQVESGRTVGGALGDHREFDPMLVQMIAVGEETGHLDEMLGFVGDAYEQQIDYLSKNLPKVIEPILLIMLAGMVALVALSLFLPIFKMVQVVEHL
jgi:type II secretory pathway component PulF